MSHHAPSIRAQLGIGPARARDLVDSIGISQPTVSRALEFLGDEIVRIGAGSSIQYALRDQGRGLPNIGIYRVDVEGRLRELGTLVPVRPEGFVMIQADGVTIHSDGLPWWLLDMRPQGYLGRAFAGRHGAMLGLPEQLRDWTDTHALRALLAYGHDAIGNLLLGDFARQRFLDAPAIQPIPLQSRGEAFVQMADVASRGEAPGSSAAGEQPKFTAYVETGEGPQHVLVKFTNADENPVSERWRDLLLAEHLALEILRGAGIPAADTQIVDHNGQRFLQVSRFDRVGERGRRAVISLAALDAEFVGLGSGWHSITAELSRLGTVTREAADRAALLFAFGTLIGNTDMHTGNLSFVSEHGRPYHLAPAYDMLPMTFSPRTGGGLLDEVPAATIHPRIANDVWQQAVELAERYIDRLQVENMFSVRFAPCIEALNNHLSTARAQINRLG